MINSETRPIFIIGNPVKHSKSPIFQNKWLEDNNINAVYLALEINKDNFDVVLTGLKQLDIIGMNVTIPYKRDVIKFVDELSNDAKTIGAVNTIKSIEGKWFGYNTDWFGVLKTLEINNINTAVNTLVIGAGGAAGGLVYGLLQYGIKNITVINRTQAALKTFVTKFSSIKTANYEIVDDIGSMSAFGLVINATSVAFESILPQFDNNTVYFDLKYYANRPDVKNYIDGKDMLIYQGARSFEIWTGVNIERGLQYSF